MKTWLIKARHPEAVILSEPCHPDDGWFFIIDVPLSEIPVKDFCVKKPRLDWGSHCPECKEPMHGCTSTAIFIGCHYCGYEVDWVYAKYKLTWKG